jgi:hypothetical protein
MLAGPEQARLLEEFEECFASHTEDHLHHEQGLSTQNNFKQQVQSLAETMKDMGNPFVDETTELLTLDSHDIVNETVVNTVRTVEELGKKQYAEYQKSVLVDHSKSIHVPIKKNSLRLFKCPASKPKTKQSDKITNLKTDVSLFSRLYIVAQHRECDMTAFFSHENHPFPPSLSDNGKLRQGNKSELIRCLDKAKDIVLEDFEASELTLDQSEEGILELELEPETILSLKKACATDIPNSFHVKVIDGAALVHILPTNSVRTFDEYASDVFLRHIRQQLEGARRVDVVWDEYRKKSIKESVREKRGKGKRRKVSGQNKLPGQWQDFLKDPENKEELFAFLSETIENSTFPPEKEVVVTFGQNVIVRGSDHSMPPCDHEEADSRMLLHLQDALQQGARDCLIRTVDTDVLIILIGKFHHFRSMCPTANIWVAFGTGRAFSYIHINPIAQSLGEDVSSALPVFHSFTGCDTVSYFFGRGKRTAWGAWLSYPEVTQAFNFIARNPFTMVNFDSDHFQTLERFVVILYDKTSAIEVVNEARMELFCHKARSMEKIPPTRHALIEHTKRATFQAGIWTTCHLHQQQTPPAEEWGWEEDKDTQSLVPVWTTLPMATEACSDFVKCGCKSTGTTGCKGKCSCVKAQRKCTGLCKCSCLQESRT